MGGLLEFLKSPLKDVLDSVGGLVDRFVVTGDEKLKAQQELLKIQFDFQGKLLELDQQWAAQQAAVITAEVKSESWMARNWRPILMLVFTYIVLHNYVIAPVFGVGKTEIPQDMWELLRIGVGGYIMGRSVEKVVPTVAEILKKK